MIPTGMKRKYVKLEKLADGRWKARVQVRSAAYDRVFTGSTKGEAEQWAKARLAELGKLGSEGTLSQSEVVEYREAKALARGEDLREVAKDWAKRNPEGEVLTVADAVERYRSERLPQLSESFQSVQPSRLKWLAQALGPVSLHEVTLPVLRKHLSDLPFTVTTRNNYVRFVKAFCSWCVEEPQELLPYSPAEGLKFEEERRGAVKYLPVVEAEKWMRTVEKENPALVPFYALSLFGGVRPVVAERMAPLLAELCDLEGRSLVVPLWVEGARINKGKGYRVEGDIPGYLWEWLSAYWDGKSPCLAGTQRQKASLLEKAGIGWPHDALRHTFGTFSYVYTRDLSKVAAWLGHSDTKVTAKHYAEATAKKKDAKQFFRLRPNRS